MSYYQHHLFNFQLWLKKQSSFIKVNFTLNNFVFSGISMLNSGCTTCIVPISWLPKEARRYILHSNIWVNRIRGSVSILGELIYDIILGEHNSPIFKNMEILVTTSMTQILIGQNILSHYSLTSYSISNQNAMVEFRHILPSDGMTHIVPLVPITNLDIFSTYNPAHGVQTIIRNEV